MRRIVLTVIILSCQLKNNLAQQWSSLGTGIGDLAYGTPVSSLVMHNGDLYAAGYFITAGGIQANNIAKWNGTNWSPLAAGIAGGYNGQGVHTQVVYNGLLYVGGLFTTAGGHPASNIAKWDGINWSEVGSGIGTPLGGWVSALAVYNGELYAGGSFTYAGGIAANNIAKWDGTNWHPVGSGITGEVYCLAVYGGALYAGGWFSEAGGTPTNNIAKWDGSNWWPLETGIGNPNSEKKVLSLIGHNGFLYAGGSFDSVGTVAANNIAEWDGSEWSALGSGIGNYYDGDKVASLTVYDDEVHAGGIFTVAGGIAANYIAKWTGTNWTNLGVGTNYGIYAMASDSLRLYVGGGFDSAGANYALGVAKWITQCPSVPPQPIIIYGDDSVCDGSSQTYFIDALPGATSYTWALPAGWTGNSSDSFITCIAGRNNGVISVSANNNCGSSTAQALPVIVNSTPQMPTEIVGNDTVCEGSSQVYSISPVPGATGYAWDLSFGWAGGMHDTSIIVGVSQTGYIDHVVSVSAYNDCGNSEMQMLPVYIKPLPWLDDISGNTKVCRGSTQTYSTYLSPNTIFSWVLPPGWSGSSTSNSITVTVGDDDGTISVRAQNDCGITAYKSLNIMIDSIALKPPEINGNRYVYLDETVDYSVDPIPNANSYAWSVSGGGTIISGQNTRNISLKWKTPGKYVLSVHAKNSCGSGADRSMEIIVADDSREDSFDVRIFPNPSHGQFYLGAKKVQGKLISAEVLNAAGQIIYRSEKLPGSNNYFQLIDLKKLLQGVYLVKVMVNNATYIRRMALLE